MPEPKEPPTVEIRFSEDPPLLQMVEIACDTAHKLETGVAFFYRGRECRVQASTDPVKFTAKLNRMFKEPG